MNVLLATGVNELDVALTERLPGVTAVGSTLYKEAVIDLIVQKNPKHIIISELLEGVISNRELVLRLRERFPELHIVYILKDKNPKFEQFLHSYEIYEILEGKFTPQEIKECLVSPQINLNE